MTRTGRAGSTGRISTLVPFNRKREECVREAVNKTRLALFNEHAGKLGDQERLLQLALNEAEALAWQTGFPQLFFPVLAAEKAEATLAWHKRQQWLKPPDPDLSFAD